MVNLSGDDPLESPVRRAGRPTATRSVGCGAGCRPRSASGRPGTGRDRVGLDPVLVPGRRRVSPPRCWGCSTRTRRWPIGCSSRAGRRHPLTVNLLGWPHRGLADAFAELGPGPGRRLHARRLAGHAPGVRCWTTRPAGSGPGCAAGARPCRLGAAGPGDGRARRDRARIRPTGCWATSAAATAPISLDGRVRLSSAHDDRAADPPRPHLGQHRRHPGRPQSRASSWTRPGAEQVAEVGRRIAGVPLRAVVTSPLRRCRQTAQALIAARTDDCPLLVEQGWSSAATASGPASRCAS